LNDRQARNRMLAMKLYPCLPVVLNDPTTKVILNIMWTDLNRQARKLAAQTLGKTGRSKELHDSIEERLSSGNVFDRIEALKNINFIGLMTSKLLNSYLKCFQDDYLAVKELACLASHNLLEVDNRIIDSLLFIARYESVNKLKSLAFRCN
jgi:HEAT repeat-containing protein 4